MRAKTIWVDSFTMGMLMMVAQMHVNPYTSTGKEYRVGGPISAIFGIPVRIAKYLPSGKLLVRYQTGVVSWVDIYEIFTKWEKQDAHRNATDAASQRRPLG
ncbi:MAG: hypothetical protein GWN86_27740 [Desulfobacterales bacterium]|nr:hypothetical protein [Desulfobacterales bacterium]